MYNARGCHLDITLNFLKYQLSLGKKKTYLIEYENYN